MLRYTFLSLHKPPLRLVRISEAGDSGTASQDGAPLGVYTLHPPSLRTKSGDRRDETKKRRRGGGGRAAAAVIETPTNCPGAALSAALVQQP